MELGIQWIYYCFPNLYLSYGSEVALDAHRWDMALNRSTLTMYAENAFLLQLYKIAFIVGWEAKTILL